MSKLEELKVAAEVLYKAAEAADEAAWTAVYAADATWAAWDAYYDELEKQRESSND
jgi:hypothetical protein